MVQVKWLKAAKEDLKDIYNFIAQDSRHYAEHQLLRIRSRVERLKQFPNLGKVVLELDDPSILEIVESHYRIIYRVVSNEEIHILMVHHGARDLGRRIK